MTQPKFVGACCQTNILAMRSPTSRLNLQRSTRSCPQRLVHRLRAIIVLNLTSHLCLLLTKPITIKTSSEYSVGLWNWDVLTYTLVNASCRELVCANAGPEFGEYEGCIVLIVKALYGLRSSGSAWRSQFSNHLQGMGFTQSLADMDM